MKNPKKPAPKKPAPKKPPRPEGAHAFRTEAQRFAMWARIGKALDDLA